MDRDSLPRLTSESGSRPISQAIAARRASLSHILSRSAPDTLTLAQLTPIRSYSGSSLPESPSCSVGTQTPSDSSLHFVFPEALDFSDDDNDVTDYRNNGVLSSESSGGRGFIAKDAKLVHRCFRRLSFQSGVIKGDGIQRRTRFAQDEIHYSSSAGDGDSVLNGIQGVGQQLRSIGDDFERTRLTRSRSLSFLQLFKQVQRRGSVP